MRSLIVSASNHRRFLAALTVALVFLITPSKAHAQFFWWADGSEFATFGPNQPVTIDTGAFNSFACDMFFPTADIHVVSGPGGATVGAANTVIGASGGLFVGETIAFTAPGGALGPGTYGIMFDNCQDGAYTPGEDTIFWPAFEVVIPANVPMLPDPSIAAIKAAAANEAIRWMVVGKFMSIAEALAKKQLKYLKKAKKWGILGALGLYHPMDVVKDAIADQVSHYNGIANDPPDPSFQQSSPLIPTPPIVPDSDEPIHRAMVGVGNAAASENAVLEALLHSLERYQGADLADRSDWALVHAQGIKALSGNLIDQLSSTNTALTAFNAAVAADPRDLDALAGALEADRARIAATGFDAAERQELFNLGMTQAEIDALRADIADDEPSNLTRANVAAAVNDLLSQNVDLTSAAFALAADMDTLIAELEAPPNFPSGRPVADAGGPYSAVEGAPVSLLGSAADDGTIAAYAWDLDRDGQFDDATGNAPTVSFAVAFNGFIGLQVTDNSGNTGVDFAYVTVGDANQPPVLVTPMPTALTQQVTAGNSLNFSVATIDPNGDPVSVRWLVDFVEVATGDTFTYTPGDVGLHYVRVEASDGLAAGGFVTLDWDVSVLAADLDGDGWHANADCNDGNPAIFPFNVEIIGNGIDDDCRAETLDGGTPPAANFTAAPSPALVGALVSFTDTSVDPDSPTLSYAWSFGDGSTSSERHPTHAFATAGTFAVSLTVTDPQLFTSTATGNVVVTHAPTASFTFSPSPGRRTSPVSFVSTSSDPDGAIAAYQWSFGDGGISSDPNPVHVYDATGTFVVQLTVTDEAGVTATASQSITITPALTDVTSLKFLVVETNCGWAANYNFSIGGVPVGTLTPSYDCTCGPGFKSITITDPAILAMISQPVCQVFDLQANSVYYFGSAHVEITRPTGVQRIRIANTNSADGPDVYSGYACSAWIGGSRSFQSALPNQDGDAIADCTDPDLDGDAVENGADNCPFVANPTQADFNGNGTGDACEDSDGDTLLDAADNCQAVVNLNQWDFDRDTIGNACDTDADGDGVLNTADNCAYVSNAAQVDTDGNGAGDACDIQSLRFRVQETTEGYPTTARISIDGVQVATIAADPVGGLCGAPATVVTITDPEVLGLLGLTPTCNAFRIATNNWWLMSWAKAEMVHYSGAVDTVVIHDKTGGSFPQYACYAWEHAQTYGNAVPDTDGDGVYNCEDPDMDSDGVPNVADNCPLTPNPGQDDVDGNGVGNACQDTDADTVLDINDNCPVVSNTNQANIDGDSMGDACDPDRDNDTVLNAADNCADNANTDQSNIDGDGLGDVCDPDMDGDSVGNGGDNCPTTVNINQRNTDGDSVGDACDPDIDNDSVLNAADNCRFVTNAGQQSTNPYGVGDACVVRPITVPWLGVPTQPHQVYSGGQLVLQGIAVYDGTYAPADIVSAVWDPGDGSAPQSVSVADPMVLELTHTYTGAANTPFTALLTVTMENGSTRSDEFRVLIQPRTIDVEANMAIDRGLWNLHKTQIRYHVGALPASQWYAPHDADYMAGTSATLNAFGVNNHRINGNSLEDPYVEDVRRGFVHLESRLYQQGISAQAAGNPDTNGNGIALYASNQVYQSGQVAEAFIAAGQQTSVAVAGIVAGRTFRDIVQDIMDGYWFGQVEPGHAARGGWHYGWNYGSADNSTAQWGAITGLAGENAWGITVPQWVKTENRDHWMRTSQRFDSSSFWHGTFGYGDANCVWSNCMSTTPSGMVQLIFDGARNDPSATTEFELRYQAAKTFLAKGLRNGYHLSDPSFGGTNYYSLFAMAKAFRLAINDDGSGNTVPAPVTLVDDNPSDSTPAFDWYRSDPGPGETAPLGVARLLISRQQPAGHWSDHGYWGGAIATAYSVIILSPTIFELAPAAMCAAVPSIAGVGDTVAFDGSGSIHNDPFGEIASYSWNFQDGTSTTISAPVSSATHVFNTLGTFNVVLTVTDTNGLSAAASCPVQIIDGNRPPSAAPGGPYNFCAGSPMVLNASGSSDPEGGALSFEWDLSSPLTFSNVDGTTAVFDATSYLASLVPGIYQIALRVTDDHGHASSVFPNLTIHAADNPDHCNTPPALTLSPNLTTYATSAAGAQVAFTVTASDPQQGNLAPVCTPLSNSVFAIGTTTVACTVTDAHGLTDTGSFTVTVLNNPPAFTPPDDIERVALTAAGASVSFTANGNDIEDGVIPAACVPASGSTFPIGTTTVNCTVTDSHGLSATGSFQVMVRPPANIGPTFTPPADINTSTTSAGGTAVLFTASGSDLEDGTIPAVCVPASGTNFAIGATTVDCTVTDSGGLTATGSFTVTVDLVVSNHPPTFTPPANMSVFATSSAGAIVAFAASGSDVEDGTIPAVCAPPSGATFPLGTTTVNCTVTDSGGLTASATFTITVRTSTKNTAPSIVEPKVSAPATSPAGAVVYFTVVANDYEDGTLATTCTPPSGSLFPIGFTLVSCTATDSGGLSVTRTFKVLVLQNARPKLLLPYKIIATATGPDGALVTYTASATDPEDGSLPVSCSAPSGSLFAIGETVVTCSATDSYGTTSTGSFRVIVNKP